ncbi:hypothetical protein CTheo_3728 [Ceratobasidium theobromae]|uniref:DUF6534 domain-containing protein n=1 Tax=Ceratobasidium theobromae TaxID=1582974 RepID=A0A5N5QML6_9AGAM|nr:hypothetical protein CTheo_3728 [Ceratobasidium theobromae]
MQVAYLFMMDTLNSACDIGLVWRYTITLFGDLPGLTHSHWLLNVEPLMTVMISSVAQVFFAWRIVMLTGRPWVGWMIAFVAFVEFASGVGCTIGAFIVNEFSRFQELRVGVIFWMGSTVLTDVLITSILCWYLHSHRTGFSRTDDILSRLIRLTMQTGLVITIWSIIDLILYLTVNNNIHLLFQLPLCKLYTNSLMSTLNCRAGWTAEKAINNTIDPLSTAAGGQSNGNTLVFRQEPDKSCHSNVVPMTTTSSSSQHADDLERVENGDETKRPVSGDFRRPRSPTAVQLATAAGLGTAFSDVTSIRSRISTEIK